MCFWILIISSAYKVPQPKGEDSEEDGIKYELRLKSRSYNRFAFQKWAVSIVKGIKEEYFLFDNQEQFMKEYEYFFLQIHRSRCPRIQCHTKRRTSCSTPRPRIASVFSLINILSAELSGISSLCYFSLFGNSLIILSMIFRCCCCCWISRNFNWKLKSSYIHETLIFYFYFYFNIFPEQ